MTPNSFKNPLVPLIADPVGIDIPIQELQQTIANVGWVEKSFGRSWLSYSKDSKGQVKYYPEVWQGKENVAGKDKDLLNVLPNDNLRSYSFFKVDDPIVTDSDYSANLYNNKSATISIIFWFNLLEINKTLDYRFTELLKTTIEAAIRYHTFSPKSQGRIKILRSWEEAANVFKGYTINVAEQQELVHPWGGFRLECVLTWRENCPTPALP